MRLLLVLVAALAFHSTTSSPVLHTSRQSIPIYGNYCGPNYGSGEPIDTLDAACQAHDYCYRDYGRYNCLCDVDLYYAADDVGGAIGNLIAAYFRVSPCSGGRYDEYWSWCGWRPCREQECRDLVYPVALVSKLSFNRYNC